MNLKKREFEGRAEKGCFGIEAGAGGEEEADGERAEQILFILQPSVPVS